MLSMVHSNLFNVQFHVCTWALGESTTQVLNVASNRHPSQNNIEVLMSRGSSTLYQRSTTMAPESQVRMSNA